MQLLLKASIGQWCYLVCHCVPAGPLRRSMCRCLQPAVQQAGRQQQQHRSWAKTACLQMNGELSNVFFNTNKQLENELMSAADAQFFLLQQGCLTTHAQHVSHVLPDGTPCSC
jgi:hypothetical protein